METHKNINKCKYIVFGFVVMLISYLVLLFMPSASASGNTKQGYITSDMNTDEILETIGKNPSNYTTFNGTFNDNMSDNKFMNDWRNLGEFIGLAEGFYNNEFCTWFIIKSKLSYIYDGELRPFECVPNVYGYYDTNINDESAPRNEYGLIDTIIGQDAIFPTSDTISKNVFAFPAHLYSEKDVYQKTHSVGIESVSWRFETLDYNKVDVEYSQRWDYVVDEETGDIIEDITDNNTAYFVRVEFDDISESTYLIFNHSNQVLVSSVTIDGSIYDLSLVEQYYGYANYLLNYDITKNGSHTYTIESFNVGSSSIDVPASEQKFRYVSNHTSTWVEAQVYRYRDVFTTGGHTFYGFDFVNKKTGEKIENKVTEITATFEWDALFHFDKVKTIKTKVNYSTKWYDAFSLSGVWLSPASSYSYSTLSSAFGSHLSDVKYVYEFNDKVINFDVLYMLYETDGGIITGSCFENGMHVEGDKVYDMDGNLMDGYTSPDGSNIVDDTGNEIQPVNPPQQDLSPSSPLDKLKDLFNTMSKGVKTTFTIIGVVLSLAIIGLCFSLIKWIIGWFKK